jgi:hypothetical protein
MEELVSKNFKFKLPHLESFNEKRDPHKYLSALNTQVSTIRAIETKK